MERPRRCAVPVYLSFGCLRAIQWDDYGADNCNGNWVADNTIATYGNECVEVKEGSSNNIVEYNTCSNQEDDESGCFCSRGDENVFRCEKTSTTC